MKWFKHENTFTNPKIKLLKRKFGIYGYGVYFQILELIGNALEAKNQKEWGYLPEEYSNDIDFFYEELGLSDTGINLQNILDYCYEIELLENKNGRIYCGKIIERCDDYTQRLFLQSPTKSEQSRNKVGQSSPRIEENRIDKNRREKRIEYLSEIPQEDLEEFSSKYTCSISQVKGKGEDLLNYCHAKGKSYKDYRAFLINALKKDYGLRVPMQNFVPDLPDKPISAEKLAELNKKKELLLGKKSIPSVHNEQVG